MVSDDLKQKIDAIASRADAASEGPWFASIEGRDHTSGSSCIVLPNGAIDLAGATDLDIDFIANARQDIPFLIHEIRRLLSKASGSPAGASEYSSEPRNPDEISE